MRRTFNAASHVQDVMRSLDDYQRLVSLVRSMTQEIERLNDDNAQLQAAVKFYRDVVRRGNRQASRGTGKVRAAKVA